MKTTTDHTAANGGTPLTARPSSPKSDWRLYAAAGAAALAAGSAADAAIIYTHPASPEVAALPGYHSGAASKTFLIGGFKASVNVHTTSGGLENVAAVGGALRFDGFSPSVSDLVAGRAVTTKNIGGAYLLRLKDGASSFALGNFQSGKTGFAGFELPNGDLGWMRVEPIDRNGDGELDAVEAIDWAYNNVAGAAITAGDTGASVPEPSALGLLAMGSAGVLAWRRRRSATPAGR